MMVIYKFGVWDQQFLSCLLFFLPYLVTISAQRTCTHLAAREGETEFITSPNYPSNYQSDTTKCWIIEAAYPSHRVKLETVDFQLQADVHCTHDFLEIREGTNRGAFVSKYCSSRRPQVTSSGRALYLRFVTDHTLTDRGFKLKYTSVESTPSVNENSNQEQSASDSDGLTTDWTVSPNLHLLIIACVVGFIFVVCLGTVVVAMKADKEPKSKKRQQRTSPSQASSQQELATHIQIEHTTHNESSCGTLEPTAPPADVPAHYGNANPSSHLETLPPSYTVAMREERDRPYLAYGNDTFGMN